MAGITPPRRSRATRDSVVDLRLGFLETRGADAVRKCGVGVLRHIHLDTLPVVPVVADTLAIRADREQSAQATDVIECGLKLGDLLGQARLERYDTHADLNARAQFVEVNRLDQVVVRAGFETRDQVSGTVPGGEEHDVEVRTGGVGADTPAQLRSFEAWHFPIDNRQ